MLNAYLYSGHSMLDLIQLESASEIRARALQKHGLRRIKFPSAGRVEGDMERMSALVKFMDELTDARIVREALVYQLSLVC